MILALCAIALIVLVVWLARSYRRGSIATRGEGPPITGAADQRFRVAYIRRGSVGEDAPAAPAEQREPPRHR